MRVLVTGSSGFIARHTVDRLQDLGHEAIRFDRRGPTDFLGDVRDATAISEAVALCDGVLHIAGVLGTAETIDNPMPAVQTNILGSLSVFQACRQYRKRAVYVTVGNYWMNNSYSITKTTAENFAWMFNAEHGTEIAVEQGDTLVEQATFTDQTGTLINDATASYELTAKYQLTDADSAAIFKVTASQTTPGVAFLTVVPSSTASLVPPAVLLYDIRVKETSGRVTTIQSGKFIVTAPVLTTP